MSRPPKPLPNIGDLYGPRPGRKSKRQLTVTAVVETAENTFIQTRSKGGNVISMQKKSFDNSYQLIRAAAVIPHIPHTTATVPDEPATPGLPKSIALGILLKRLQAIEEKLDKTLDALGLS